MIPEVYDGREHQLVKHKLLAEYLMRLFMILGQVESSICFIDCFAGPWSSQDEDLKDTSIGIAYDLMKKCRDGLYESFNRKVKFRALFVEKTDSAYEKLECYCTEKSCNSIELDCYRGEFYDLRSDILNWCGDKDFAFFFIDPTGWKNVIEIPTIKPLLQRSRSEFLINMMFSFLVRVISQERHSEDIYAIFGEVPDTSRMTTEQKESYLLYRYRENAKAVFPSTGGKPRSAYVKVEHASKSGTKYDLVYFTRSSLGIKVFMEVSEKLDWIQRSMKAEVQQRERIRKSRQLELFPSRTALSTHSSNRPDIEKVKNYWIRKLSKEYAQFGIEELADMLEETGWFISDLQKAFKKLEKEGLAQNLNSKRNRPKHAIHFDTNNGNGEFLRKMC